MNPPLIRFFFFLFLLLVVVLTKSLVAECSDGSTIFQFTDAEDLKRVKELRESREGEFQERMEASVESSQLAGESEVLDRELEVDNRVYDVEMGISKSDAVSEKAVEVVGSKMCLEREFG